MKTLGRGLNVFFNSDNLFKKALELDEKGNIFYAFHYYMKAAESNEEIKSKALNNAAVILAENGFEKEAIELLKKSLEANPDNKEAKENLEYLEGMF
ncbi:hypothetical protein [Marinitoga aeolica]|uniref:Tetratricopeptide repeat protein n=1 Tax=Marinitoga aeolica TaxID=2809031 RepID=A0ABY8PTA1_9BACT|nr:hypothetical protein [Marinitoga aeolica]WGS65857.1 hypothetical protein JRV97_04720 [Marinitoga aeolica]